jgi:hypothetical protein
MTLSITTNKTQDSIMTLRNARVSFCYFIYAECRYAECRGAILPSLCQRQLDLNPQT